MKTFRLCITTPSGDAFDGQVVRFSCRGIEGELAVMADHVPFVTYVKEGECRITDGDGIVRRAQSEGGLLTVNNDTTHFLPTSFAFQDK